MKNKKDGISEKPIVSVGYYKTEKEANNYSKNSIVYIINKNKFLVFVAGNHILNLNSKQQKMYLNFLQNIFKTMKPNLVLIESPVDTSRETIKLGMNITKKRWGENEYATLFANEFKGEIRGMDASTKDQNNVFLMHDRKRNPKLLLFFNFFTFYFSAATKYQKGDMGIDAIYKKGRDILSYLLFYKKSLLYGIRYDILRIHEHMKESRSLEDTIDRILQEIVDKYIKDGMNIKSVIDIKHPCLYVGEVNGHIPNYKINRIMEKWFSIRNESMVNTCVKSLNKHKVVLAMAGASHIKGIQKMLNSKLLEKYGNVESMNWNKFSDMLK